MPISTLPFSEPTKGAMLAIEILGGLMLTAVEKVELGRVHGVPLWLKDG